MPNIPVFIVSCPGCAMKKQLSIDCLGRTTGCMRCGKEFIAEGADSHSAAIEDPVHYWINFTDHPEESGGVRPVYLNVVRDPADTYMYGYYTVLQCTVFHFS